MLSTKQRKRHSPERIVAELRAATALLNAGQDMAVVLQTLEERESINERWHALYGVMRSDDAVRLKKLEDKNRRLKRLVAFLSLVNQILRQY